MKKTLTIAVLLVLTAIAEAKQYSIEKNSGSVVFKAKALGINFDGKGEGAEGKIEVGEKVSGELTVNLNSFDTGIGLRNTHMKEKYLETAKYPNGKLIIKEIKGFDEKKQSGEYDFDGTLIVRDLEKPITKGKVKLEKIENGYSVKATFDTKISNYSIPLPKYAGIALKDEITVVATTKATVIKSENIKSASK